MDSNTQDEHPHSSPTSSQPSTTLLSVSPSSYLTVPGATPTGINLSLPGPSQFAPEEGLDFLVPFTSSRTVSNPVAEEQEAVSSGSPSLLRLLQLSRLESSSNPLHMSVYSSTSADSSTTEYSAYSNPPPKKYRVPTFEKMSDSRKVTSAEKEHMIQALQSHRINTLVELRRIEKAFAVLGSPDVNEPMTAAWSYYVNSHSLLTELRGLTKNYPFSSECLEEAKKRVYTDPQSNRSWNFCWLVLSKIQSDQLIPYYAQYQAAQPTMWGGRTPSPDGIKQLSEAFTAEWKWALGQMLRHWDQPPTR